MHSASSISSSSAHVLAIEHRPPFGLGLPLVKIDKLTGKLSPRAICFRYAVQQASHQGRSSLLGFFTLGFARRIDRDLPVAHHTEPWHFGRPERQQPVATSQERPAICLVVGADLFEKGRIAGLLPAIIDDHAVEGRRHAARSFAP